MPIFERRFETTFKQGEMIKILVDKVTGVNYLLVNGIHETSITPLLDENGKPVITKK